MNDRTNSIQFYYYTPTNSVNMQKYDILSAIGQGAYGVVLKCRDISSNSFVAIKKFKDTDEQQHTRKTTMREVKVLKMTNHPNIVELKEAFRKKGTVYLVFQYVQNNLLEVLQKSQNGLKLPLIRKIIFQLLKGLQYLHDQNIVHRDIKPQNLLIGANSGLKICDFGFARHLKAQKGEELTDYVATRWYRPPQLLVGGQYGKQIDMWAVACIMCELIDGNPLFPGQNQLDQLFLIQKTLGTLPSELHQKLVKNPRFLGMKFPEINNLDKLEKKYFGKICQKGLNFIKDLLKLNPKQRLTAAEALRHPYFQSEAEGQKSETIQTLPDKNSRKDTYTSISTTNRKKELDLQTKLYGGTKYGKIYKRTNNAEQISNIYQSSNNCKLTNLISKSLGKQNKKVVINQDLSLDKYGKKNMLKTQAKGFYNDNNEQILHGDIFKKSMQLNVGLSNQQLPFLLNSQLLSVEETSRKQFNISKKKPIHILGQKPSTNPKQLMTHYK